MTLQLQESGPISFSQINAELGLATTTNNSLNATIVRTLAGIASGVIAMSNLYGKSNGPVGQILYEGPGDTDSSTTFSFVVPAGVTKINAVCIGGSLRRNSTVLVQTLGNAGSTIGGDIGGGNGGIKGSLGGFASDKFGLGGAGGYTGNGGNGGTWQNNAGTWSYVEATAGEGGGGGGGSGGSFGSGGTLGGSVGVLGQGASGAASGMNSSAYGGNGSGGSLLKYGGGAGSYISGYEPYSQSGGSFGEGLRWRNNIVVTPGETLTVELYAGWSFAAYSQRACRIIWGSGRSFPSTNTGNL